MRIQNPVDGVVQQAVAHLGLVDVAWLWVVNLECHIRAVAVGFIREFPVEREYVAYEVQGEYGDIPALPLFAQKLPPCGKKILHGNDIMENMTRPSALSLSLSVTPRS